jgi:hypothetical protein
VAPVGAQPPQPDTLKQCYLNHAKKEARRKDSTPSVPDANRMPNGKPKDQIVSACLLSGRDGPSHGQGAGISFAE